MIEPKDQKSLADQLQEKIKVLHDSIWERRADWPRVSKWLDQFGDQESAANDRLEALYLLSNFMYFGTNEIRALLRSLYRDVFRPTVIADLRSSNPNLTADEARNAFLAELKHTRFVSLGNPSESSAFLLYYFRQENFIARDCFISGAEIFSISKDGNIVLRNKDVTRYVFLDDMCGSGDQGESYSENTVVPLRQLNSDIKVYYYALFGMSGGLSRLRALHRFDTVHPVVELDESFRCFSSDSRVYRDAPSPLSRDTGRALAEKFGVQLQPDLPLGWSDGQLLLGFAYNTPDNSLPIIWSDGTEQFPWAPVFKRYAKLAYD